MSIDLQRDNPNSAFHGITDCRIAVEVEVSGLNTSACKALTGFAFQANPATNTAHGVQFLNLSAGMLSNRYILDSTPKGIYGQIATPFTGDGVYLLTATTQNGQSFHSYANGGNDCSASGFLFSNYGPTAVTFGIDPSSSPNGSGEGLTVHAIRIYAQHLTVAEAEASYERLSSGGSRRVDANTAADWSTEGAWRSPLGTAPETAPAEGADALLELGNNAALTVNAADSLGELALLSVGTPSVASPVRLLAGAEGVGLRAERTRVQTNVRIEGGVSDLGTVGIARGIRLDLASGEIAVAGFSGTGALRLSGATLGIGTGSAVGSLNGVLLDGGTFRATGSFVSLQNFSVNGTGETAATLCAEAGETLTLSGSFSGEGLLNIGSARDTGTVRLEGDMSSFTGSLALKHGKLELWRNRPTLAEVAAGTTLQFTVTPDERIKGDCSLEVGSCAEDVTIIVRDAAGNDVTYSLAEDAEHRATFENGKLSIPVESRPQQTGSIWWWDYEFDGDATNVGSDGMALTFEGGSYPYKGSEYTDADGEGGARALKLPTRPYRAVDAYPDTFTAVMYCKASPQANGVMVSFGTKAGHTVSLLTGREPDKGDMRLILTTGTQVTDLVENLRVPYARTQNHIYAFTFGTETTVSEMGFLDRNTVIRVYKDGAEVASYRHQGVIELGGGFQIGSIYGGISGFADVNMLPVAPEGEAPATMEFLRVCRGVLSPEAMLALAEAYPYTSPAGAASRDVTSGDTQWGAEEAWGQNNGTGEVRQTLPDSGTNVTLEATGESLVSLEINLGEGVATPYETLTFKGAAPVALTAGTGELTVSGVTTVKAGAHVTLPMDVVHLGRVVVEEGASLTLECSGLYLASLPYALTGFVDAESATRIGVAFTKLRPWEVTLARNPETSMMMVDATPLPIRSQQVGADGDWATLTWTWEGQEEPVKLNLNVFTGIATIDLGEGGVLAPDADIVPAGRFTLAGTGTVSLAGMTLGANADLTVGENAILDLGVGLAARPTALTLPIHGAGTVKLGVTSGTNSGSDSDYNNAFSWGTDFTGTTHVVSGWFGISSLRDVGTRLILEDGVNMACTAGQNLGRGLALEVRGNTQFIVNTKTLYEISGTEVVGAGTLLKTGGGDLRFHNCALSANLATSGNQTRPQFTGTTVVSGRLSGSGPIEVGATSIRGDVTFSGDAEGYSGTLTVVAGSTLTATGDGAKPFGTGNLVVNGTVTLGDGDSPVTLPRVSGSGTIQIGTRAVTLGAACEGPSVALGKAREGGTWEGGSLVGTGTLSLPSGRTLSGVGTVGVPLTLAAGAVIDATAASGDGSAPIAATQGVTVPASGTVSLRKDELGEAFGAPNLSSPVAFALAADAGAPEGAVLIATPKALVLAKRTPNEAAGENADAIAAFAAGYGVYDGDYGVTLNGAAATAKAVDDVLGCFTDAFAWNPASEEEPATVDVRCHFGIKGITICQAAAGDGFDVCVTVGLEDAGYAEGTELRLFLNGALCEGAVLETEGDVRRFRLPYASLVGLDTFRFTVKAINGSVAQ